MAYARKCDRCGKCFDPFETKGVMCRFRNPMFQTSNDIREGVIGRLMFSDSPDAYVDLCTECSEMFETFMSGGEPEAKKSDRIVINPADIFERWFFDKKEDLNDGQLHTGEE